MKLFAALERALLARWRKIKVALKVNKWPLLSLKEQRLQLKKQYLESLFRKKWQKFVKSIYDVGRTQVPPLSQNDSQHGRLWHVSHGMRLVKPDLTYVHNHNKDAVKHGSSISHDLFATRDGTVSFSVYWVSSQSLGLICNVWERWNLNTISDWTAIIST